METIEHKACLSQGFRRGLRGWFSSRDEEHKSDLIDSYSPVSVDDKTIYKTLL